MTSEDPFSGLFQRIISKGDMIKEKRPYSIEDYVEIRRALPELMEHYRDYIIELNRLKNKKACGLTSLADEEMMKILTERVALAEQTIDYTHIIIRESSEHLVN